MLIQKSIARVNVVLIGGRLDRRRRDYWRRSALDVQDFLLKIVKIDLVYVDVRV